MLRSINGQTLEIATAAVRPLSDMILENTLEAIEPGQDFEVVVDFRPDEALDLNSFYGRLELMGTSIQVGEGDGMYRLHIHVPTEKRYEPIDYTMSLGTITKVAIENLIDQMNTIEEKARGKKLKLPPIEPGQIAVVAVSPGAGIARVFASLGVAGLNTGTNALLMSPSGLIEYDFGPNSFQRHCQRVEDTGARLEIVNLPNLGLDLDIPEDLELIRKLELEKAIP